MSCYFAVFKFPSKFLFWRIKSKLQIFFSAEYNSHRLGLRYDGAIYLCVLMSVYTIFTQSMIFFITTVRTVQQRMFLLTLKYQNISLGNPSVIQQINWELFNRLHYLLTFFLWYIYIYIYIYQRQVLSSAETTAHCRIPSHKMQYSCYFALVTITNYVDFK